MNAPYADRFTPGSYDSDEADCLPREPSATRFVVHESWGWRIGKDGARASGATVPGCTFTVHDRANLSRVVGAWATETDSLRPNEPRTAKIARLRGLADELAARLNAEYGVG